MMGFIRKGRNKKQLRRKKALAKLAMAPATLNVAMLKGEAQEIFRQCVIAIREHSVEHLPMEHMSKEFYNYLAKEIMSGNLDHVFDSTDIVSFEYAGKDVSAMYAISKIFFLADCGMEEDTKQKFQLVFSFYSRTGLTLCDVQKVIL